MKFHLAHLIPDRRMHGLNGYKEVIETVAWGLGELGHEVTYAVNEFARSAINIVFGAQVAAVETLERLRPDTIIYNFEQLRGHSSGDIKPSLHLCASRFRVWDYSQFNADAWRMLGLKQELRIVPVGFAPVLQRIDKARNQDIEVLIYGLTSHARLGAFHALSQAGISTVFVSGLYGEARDALIARSKLVLNITLYERPKIFEIVRVSYLLANRKAVVCQKNPAIAIEDDMASAVCFSPDAEMVDRCLALLGNNRERRMQEEAGFAAIQRRDIKAILAQALA